MNNNLRILLFIAVFGIIFGCASNTFAQTAPPIKVGAYDEIEPTNADVIAAANFAVKMQAKKQRANIKLVAVNYATRQVVAGMNYQVCMNVETTDRKTKIAAPQNVQAIVYRNLGGKYKLTSWTVAACTDAAPNTPVN